MVKILKIIGCEKTTSLHIYVKYLSYLCVVIIKAAIKI